MKNAPATTRLSIRALAVAMLVPTLAVAGFAQGRQAPQVQIPDPGVPQIMTMEGLFVRTAYNNEGYVVVAYRAANNSIGEPWVVLDVGIALRKGQKDQKLTRDEISLSLPSGKTIPLPSNEEYLSANLLALAIRAQNSPDPLAFPDDADGTRCREGGRRGFFFDQPARTIPPLDGLEFQPQCRWAGFLYFPVQGGVADGQDRLNIKFDGSLVRVPFRIMTRDEEKVLDDNYESVKKQMKEASTSKKK